MHSNNNFTNQLQGGNNDDDHDNSDQLEWKSDTTHRKQIF